MNEQDLTIGQNLYFLFESLPPDSKKGFLVRLFHDHAQEMEDLAFHLACKAASEKGDWVSEEEFFKTLKERI